MDELSESVSLYFNTRTKGKNGAIKDLIQTEHSHHHINLGDNDYLNLTNHEYVIGRQIEDLKYSTNNGSVMSSVFLQNDDPHCDLEKDLGSWFGKNCYLAQSGYAANTGLMHAICRPGTHVYADKLLHMSFYDGLASRRANIHFNRHNDTAQLEANIREHGAGIILVESVYSTGGDFAPLEEIIRIKTDNRCVLVVDESHSLGVFNSKSYVHAIGAEQGVDFVTASLAKAYATRAGVVFASNTTFIKEKSFSYIFSSSLTRNDIVRLRAMWEVIKSADNRRDMLMKNSALLRLKLSQVTTLIAVEDSVQSPIIGLAVKDEEDMARLHKYLSASGILAAPFFAPATPAGSPIIRFSVNSDITPADISEVSEAVAKYVASTIRGAE